MNIKTKKITLLLLFSAAFFNYADRYMLGILIPDIKNDMNLSDTQIGFMTGIAFTLFYATLGIPIARMADIYSRRKIISCALFIWSLMTAVCGIAQNFVQLTIARVLVGVGEAGCTPPSQSIVSDTFHKNERSKALSMVALGSPAGLLIGFLVGGWITDFYGWRVALFAFAIPGIILSIFIFFLLKEPMRGESDGSLDDGERKPFWNVFYTLLSKPTFRNCALGQATHGIVYLSLINWLPSFFNRTHGLSIGEIGTWLAFVLGFSQLGGIYLGGVLGDRLGSKDPRWYLWISGYTILLATPFYFIIFLYPNPQVAFFVLMFPFFLSVMQAGPSYNVIQTIAGSKNRAVASAINILIINIIAGAIGPQIVGLLSDQLANIYGESSLKYALLSVSIICSIWASIHFTLASRTIRDEINTN